MTSLLISKFFTNSGYFVFLYQDYQSLIKGGHNFSVLEVSDSPVYSHSQKYDIIVALDQNTIDLHQKNLKPKGFILSEQGFKGRDLIGLDLQKIIGELGLKSIAKNNILVGYVAKTFGLPFSLLNKTIEKIFTKKKEEIEKALKSGYDMAEAKTKLKLKEKEYYLLTGNEAVSAGALASGLDMYIAYPITPATAVLHYLAQKQRERNIVVLQLENEIAVINAALGASFAGAMTMIGTSGAGFSLMAEGISLEGISEVPLVIYLGQRTGPATGLPTYTGQGDLKFALNAGHGEFPKVAVVPGDAKEAFQRTIEAFYLAYKYRTLSIILSDKHLAESYYSFDQFEGPKVSPNRFIVQKPVSDYKSYLFTKTGVSPRAVPGQGPVVRATSYEHNEYGYTIEDSEMTVKMNDKRQKKMAGLEKEVSKLKPVSIYGRGENLIVSAGSTKGAIVDALKKLKNFRFLQISYLSPFPSDLVKREIMKSKKVVLVENNLTGLLGQVIAENTGCQIKNKILKYDGRPFFAEEIISEIKKII